MLGCSHCKYYNLWSAYVVMPMSLFSKCEPGLARPNLVSRVPVLPAPWRERVRERVELVPVFGSVETIEIWGEYNESGLLVILSLASYFRSPLTESLEQLAMVWLPTELDDKVMLPVNHNYNEVWEKKVEKFFFLVNKSPWVVFHIPTWRRNIQVNPSDSSRRKKTPNVPKLQARYVNFPINTHMDLLISNQIWEFCYRYAW